jgi:hypothetical protein
MALKGCYKTWKVIEDPGGGTAILEHPDGSSETVPNMIEVVDQQWDEAYVRVVSYHCWRMNSENMSLDINYFVWENEEAANSGEWEEGMVYNMVIPVNEITWEESKGNTWEKCYSILLEEVGHFKGFESV